MIIDRRKIKLNTDVSVNRYLERIKRIALKEKDLTLDQPGFWFDSKSGEYDYITIGNDKWMRGDIIEEDEWDKFIREMLESMGEDGGDASGNEDGIATNGSGDGKDGFNWTEEDLHYVNTIFDGLKLPNLTKKSQEAEDKEIIRSGYSTSGSNLDLMRTFLNSVGRRFALKTPLEEELKKLKKNKIKNLELIKELEEKLKSIAYIDDIDVRYKRFEEQITPSKKMVMFLLLDVSGSMGQKEKNLAKMFSKLLVTFLGRNYDKCAIEYITFTDTPLKVNHREFFYGSRSGGTELQPALEMAIDIINEKYQDDWNIYSTIFSDTGISALDVRRSKDLFANMLQFHQFLIYVNISTYGNDSIYYDSLTREFINNYAFGTCSLSTQKDVIEKFVKMFSGV